MTDKVLIDSKYIADLSEAFQTMAEAKHAAQDSMRDDGEDYPVFVPKYGDTEKENCSAKARDAAISSISQFYINSESNVDAGLLCASEKTVVCVENLNTAKAKFKGAIMALREHIEEQSDEDVTLPGKQIIRLLDERFESHGFRSEALKQAFSTVGINELNLRKCYAETKIMPKNLDVFCWTWATRHSRGRKISLAEANKRVNSHFKNNKDALEVNIRRLNECKPNEILVEKVELNNQLRANYGYLDDKGVQRASCSISGVVIVQGKTLPRYVWRDDPKLVGKKPQVKRKSTINAVALIPQLGLYRYAKS